MSQLSLQLLSVIADVSVKGSIVILIVFSVVYFFRKLSASAKNQLFLCAVASLFAIPLFSVFFSDISAERNFSIYSSAESENPQTRNQQYSHNAFNRSRDSTMSVAKFPEHEGASNLPTYSQPPETGSQFVENLPVMLILIWFTGTFVLMVALLLRVKSVNRFINDSNVVSDDGIRAIFNSAKKEMGIHGEILLLTHPRIPVAMVWGPPKSAILLPSDYRGLSNSRLRLLFLHELAHIKRKDVIAKILANIICALFWFNPFVWIVAQRLLAEQETAADDLVLSQGVKPSEYTSYLLATIRQIRESGVKIPETLPATSILGGNKLKHRLLSILSNKKMRSRPGRLITTTMAVLTFTAVLLLNQIKFPLIANTAAEQEISNELSVKKLDELLDPLFEDYMKKNHIAGSAIAIVKDGKMIFSKGYGKAHVEMDRKVDPDKTIFRIGSISKVFTGFAVLQLVDKGLLDLNEDVNNYLTDFKVGNEFPEPVRVKHLLTHTAGFDQLGTGRHVLRESEVRPLKEFLEENLVRFSPPGKVTCYDTYAIVLAGHLVEKLSGMPYHEYLRRNIFEPLDMTRSNIYVPDHLTGDLSIGYEFRGEWIPQRWEFMNTNPASTINSTAADMSNFMIMLLQDGEFNGKRLLSRELAVAMKEQQFTNHELVPGYGYTLQIDTAYGVDAVSHGGSMTGFASKLYLVPQENVGVYISYNQESGGLLSYILSRLVKKLVPEASVPSKLDKEPDLKVDVQRFAGTYAWNMYNHTQPGKGGWSPRLFELNTNENGELMHRDQACRVVRPLVLQREDGLLLVFRENHEGEISHMLIQQVAYERISEHVLKSLSELTKLWEDEKFDQAIAYFQKIENPHSAIVFTAMRAINQEGYRLLGENKYSDAIGLFKINIRLFPDSANAYDSLAEAYLRSGDRQASIAHYKKALERDPFFLPSRMALERLESASERK